MGVDPLADKYPSWSPINYTLNNPLNLVDPDGRAPGDYENLFVGLLTTAYYETKHSVANLMIKTGLAGEKYSNAPEGMKYEVGYKTDDSGNEIFESEVRLVPTEGAVQEVVNTALDIVNVATAGNPSGALLSSTGAKTQATRTAKDGVDAISNYVGDGAKVVKNKHGDTIVQSADGMKEVRFDIKNPSPHKNPHTHVIEYKKVKNKKVEKYNKKIFPKDLEKE